MARKPVRSHDTINAMQELLHQLVAKFALSSEQSARLWQLSGLHAPKADLAKVTQRGLGAVAALLLGAGLIFWVAANWQEQTRHFKFYLIQAVLLVTLASAFFWSRGRTAMLLLATLALGGLFAFIGQTYQTGADPWQLFAAWGALALLWMFAARSDLLWALWVLIVGTGIALWSGNHLFEVHFGHFGLYSLLTPALWALLVLGVAYIARTNLGGYGSARFSLRLALILALSAWCTYGLSALNREQPALPFILNGVFVVGAGLVAWISKPRDITMLAAVVLALDALFLGLVLRLLSVLGLNDGGGIGMIFVFGCIAAVTIGFSGNWVYQQQRKLSQS
jgi:uncharacterized membrane protein